MQFLNHLSVKHKLMVIAMLVSGSALLMASIAFVIFEEASARKQMTEALSTTAAMTAANSTAGLSFDEAGSVEQALKSLSAQPDIVQACVYDKNGRVFARYLRDGMLKNSAAPAVENVGCHMDRHRMRLFQPISLAGETIGVIYLEEDLSQLTARLWRYLLIGSLVMLAATGVAFFLSIRLQKVISGPLSDLAQTVAVVRANKNYSVRAQKQGDDELGSLIDGFNEMLAQIQERDTNLERRVSARTQELAESLSVLNATLSSTTDGILVINPQGKKIFQNRRNVELWKLPAEIANTEEDPIQSGHVVEMTRDPSGFRQRSAYSYAHPDEPAQFEIALKDGTLFDCVTAPVLDQDGRNYGRIWTFRDVTQSRKYEAALRESQARFKFIFESVPVGIASQIIYPDGQVAREVNRAHLLICGLTREQHETPGIYGRLIHPEDRARQEHLMSLVTEGKLEQFSLEKRYSRLDGTQVWVSFTYQRQRYADGSFEELTTLVNITESKRAEAALRASEANYYSLVDQMPAGIFRKNTEGRYVFVNSWFCRIKGVKPENFLDKLPPEVISNNLLGPDGADAEAAYLSATGTEHHELILRTGQQIEFEEQHTASDGKVSYFHVVKSPVYGPDGTIMGSQGILLDVTQRKLAEAELAYERDLLRTLLDNSRDHIYFKDTQSRFIKNSSSQARQFGVENPEDLVGKTDFDFFSEEHAREAFEDEQKIIRTGQPIIGKAERERWKDGRGESWVLTNKMPLRNNAGKIIGTFGISKDITSIKQAEAELAYERDLLKALLDQSPDAIFFKDLDSRYVKLSQSVIKYLFQSASARYQAANGGQGMDMLPPHLTNLDQFQKYIIGKSDADFYDQEYAAEFLRDEQTIIQTGRAMEGKVERTMGADGQPTWRLTTKTPWHDHDGKIIGTFGTARNITDLKLAEAKVEKAHQQLLETSRLAGMAEVATSVLHNVGNVLNNVNISTSLVLDLVKKSRLNNLGRLATMIQEQRDNLATFFETDPRGRQLPAYLLQLAQHLAAEQGQLTTEIELTRKNIEHIRDIVTMQQNYAKVSGVVEKVKVADLVEDAIRMNAGALTRHQVEIVRDFPTEPIECHTERHKVLQILVNLIRNAKYACDESGRQDKRLTMQIRPGDGRVQIIAVDNGVGIPAENLTRIFNHGFTTRENGHGFGLHSGALAASELGGSLTVHSDGPGKGASFTLEIPLHPPQDA